MLIMNSLYRRLGPCRSPSPRRISWRFLALWRMMIMVTICLNLTSRTLRLRRFQISQKRGHCPSTHQKMRLTMSSSHLQRVVMLRRRRMVRHRIPQHQGTKTFQIPTSTPMRTRDHLQASMAPHHCTLMYFTNTHERHENTVAMETRRFQPGGGVQSLGECRSCHRIRRGVDQGALYICHDHTVDTRNFVELSLLLIGVLGLLFNNPHISSFSIYEAIAMSLSANLKQTILRQVGSRHNGTYSYVGICLLMQDSIRSLNAIANKGPVISHVNDQ